MANLCRFRDYVCAMTRLVESAGAEESRLLGEGAALLGDLVRYDDWLPEPFAVHRNDGYNQYLLHCDPMERFSVVSFVWGPGVRTPVHDHTVWGLVGMLRGAEVSTAFARSPQTGRLVRGAATQLEPGDVEQLSPTIGDIHVVENAYADRPSISIHCYGANIGAVRRRVYDPETGEPKRFISGYTGAICPNIWDRSRELQTA